MARATYVTGRVRKGVKARRPNDQVVGNRHHNQPWAAPVDSAADVPEVMGAGNGRIGILTFAQTANAGAPGKIGVASRAIPQWRDERVDSSVNAALLGIGDFLSRQTGLFGDCSLR